MTAPATGREHRRDNRTALIRAAERLFADRGVYSVSLREVNRAAQQKNATALQYHFRDRAGLLEAVLQRHGRAVAAERHQLLDDWVAADARDVRRLVGALVDPLVARIDDRDGGADYLMIAAEVLNRTVREVKPGDPANLIVHDESDSLGRWSDLIAPHMPRESVGGPLHRRFIGIRMAHGEAARRAREHLPGHEAFSSHLVDLVIAILVTPPSAETTLLMRPRKVAPPRR